MIVFLFLLSVVLLVLLSDELIDALVRFGKEVGWSDFFVGFFMLALGTSLPELMSMLVSSIEGAGLLGLGTVVGSNITNVLLVIGFISLLTPLDKLGKSDRRDAGFLIVSTFVFVLLLIDGELSRLDGGILLTMFIMYYALFHTKFNVSVGHVRLRDVFYDSIIIALSLAGVVLAAWVTVDTALLIIKQYSISMAVFGATAVAIGTSLPELVTSISAVKKRRKNITSGNIIGSNISNILLVAAVGAVISPIHFSNWMMLAFMLVSTIAYAYLSSRRELNKVVGVIFLAMYIVFLLAVFSP